MLRIIGEIAAAVLTASALLVTHAKSETVIPGAPVSCVTESMLLARLGRSPYLVLRGRDLETFKRHIQEKGGNPPDDDEILVFEEDIEKALFISFKQGCVTHAITATQKEIAELLEGA
jgi:hypothetical protein